MKVRNGFVSNSSTSSYTIMTTKEAWDNAIKEMGEEWQAVLDSCYIKPKEQAFLGTTIVTAGYMSGNYDAFEDANSALGKAIIKKNNIEIEDPDEDWIEWHEIMEYFINKMKETADVIETCQSDG